MNPELRQSDSVSCIAAAAIEEPYLDDPSVAFGHTAPDFKNWNTDETPLAVWHRKAPADIAERFAQVQLERMVSWRRVFDVTDAGQFVTEAIGHSDVCDPELARVLVAAIRLLTQSFADSTRIRRIEARLDVIEYDACRRFLSTVIRRHWLSPTLDPAPSGSSAAIAQKPLPSRKTTLAQHSIFQRFQLAFLQERETDETA